MAAALGVRQNTISRLEKRSDMLLFTVRQYVESMGGKLELVAKFPDRPPVVIDHIGGDVTLNKRGRASRRAPLPPGAGAVGGGTAAGCGQAQAIGG